MRLGSRELVVLLMILAIPVAAYALVFRPQNAEIRAAAQEIEHKRERLEQLRRETSRNEDLERANAEIQGEIAKIEDRLPSSQGVDRIVREVSALAVAAGLQPPTMKSEGAVAASLYKEQPLKMSTRGDFLGFYRFMQAVERMPRITRVTEMNLRRDDKTNEIEAQFTLSIYFQDESSAGSVTTAAAPR